MGFNQVTDYILTSKILSSLIIYKYSVIYEWLSYQLSEIV